METEVKIRVPDRRLAETRLREAGFRVSVERLFEANNVYDTSDKTLRRREMLLRLRQAGEKTVLTWKGPAQPGPHKSREEIETTLGSFAHFEQILAQLGYTCTFRYEKYRTEYVNGGHGDGVVTVDETPIGDFLEIEGEASWIDSTASRLGFSKQDYVLGSYGKLYLEDCGRRHVAPGDMVFSPR